MKKKFSYSQKTLLTVSFLLLSVFLVSCIPFDITEEKEKPTLYGNWVSEENTLFEINKDDTYGFYKNADDLSDYYYKGPLVILQGKEAREDLIITDEEWERLPLEDEDYIFSMKFFFEYLFSEGIDKSDNLYKDNYMWYFCMINEEDPNTAIFYNIETGVESVVSRNEE